MSVNLYEPLATDLQILPVTANSRGRATLRLARKGGSTRLELSKVAYASLGSPPYGQILVARDQLGVQECGEHDLQARQITKTGGISARELADVYGLKDGESFVIDCERIGAKLVASVPRDLYMRRAHRDHRNGGR